MIRNFALLFTFAALAFTGCEKVKPLLNKFRKATPAPASPAIVASAAAPVPEATPKPKARPKPGRPVIDTHAQVIVLCYHRLEGRAGGGLSIEPATFEKQMQEIKDAGLAVISMKDFLAWRRNEKNIPPKSVIITIDDGYASGYEVGVPILKKFGFPATFFVYTTYLNSGGKSLSWDRLEELRDAGFDIGCHTVSHVDLRRKPAKFSGEYDAWLKDELERSKKIIEDHLGIRCATLAYPYGWHNEKVREATKAAGYEAAFTTYGQRLGHATNALTLGRYDVTTKDRQGHDSFSVAVSFTGMLAQSAEPELGQDAAASMVTQPMHNEVVRDQKPVIKANLSTMGDLDAGSVKMLISGIGAVPAKFDAETSTITYSPVQPLAPRQYTVIVGAKSGGQKVGDVRWTFTVDPNAAPSADGGPTFDTTPPPVPVGTGPAKPRKR